MTESNLSSRADESVATGTLMPLVSLRKHYKLSRWVFIVVVLLGLPFAWFKGAPYYSATAVIHVAPHVASVLEETKEQELPSREQYRQFLEQQAGTVARYDLLLAAFKKLGDKRFFWQLPKETERDAAERLQAALVITPVNDTYLLSVTLESDKKEGLDEIVNTVVENYVENAHENQLIYASKERIQLLYIERDKLKDIISTKKKQLVSIAQELGVTTFVDSTINPYDALLTDSQSAYSKAQRERITDEASLLLFEDPKNLKDTNTAALDGAVAEIVYKDPGLTSLKANMYQRRSELVRLISGLDPKHPGYAQIKSQLEVIEADVIVATEQLIGNVKRMLLEERRSKVTLSKKIEQDLLAQITMQKKNATWFSTLYNDGLTLNRDIKSLYSQLETVENRSSFLELESKAPGIIRIESLARPAELPVRGGRKKIFLMIVVLGIIMACGVPIVIDMLDKRIRTAGQVEKLLGYKPLAELLESNQNDDGSQNNTAHQRRRLALALERERKQSDKSSSLILLTSVVHNSAVTSLALELAMDYKKIDEIAIVVEVNLLTSDARYVNKDNSAGLVNLLFDSELAVSKVINPADARYPDRISIGLSKENLLFGYQHLQKILEKISETYSVVILDAAPILYSADTEFFVSISDITLLLIAANQVKQGEMKRAVKLLERIDPKAIGFVVTRLEIFQGGGYYASMNNIYSQKETEETDSRLVADYYKKNDR
ncbi:MAG: chain length determinant protein [Methylococcales bacterium]